MVVSLPLLVLILAGGFLEMNWLLDGFITAGEGAKCCASEVLLAIAALAVLFVDDPWLRPTFRSKAFGDCRALEHPSRALAPSLTQPSIASSGSRRSLPQCTGFLEMNWLLDGFITAGEGAKCCASEVLLAIAALAMLFVDDPWLRPTFRSKAFGDCRALEHPSRALAPSLTQPSIASSGSRRSLPQCTGFLEMNWLLDGFITAGEGAKCCASEVLLAIAALAMLFVDDPWLRPTFRSKVIL
ncbi:hypothetical protein ZIOFF_062638 [Zingiber officinale]|uniref:Uncharacterized protein n=1 Tax=Zingiber officinale TaxID=94328 RepID=A0A8J5F5N4_ZINOF|nr:hypothetical protein ZIOFF_062638 [Zingiber officinale]